MADEFKGMLGVEAARQYQKKKFGSGMNFIKLPEGKYLGCENSVITAVSASGPPSLGVDPQ